MAAAGTIYVFNYHEKLVDLKIFIFQNGSPTFVSTQEFSLEFSFIEDEYESLPGLVNSSLCVLSQV